MPQIEKVEPSVTFPCPEMFELKWQVHQHSEDLAVLKENQKELTKTFTSMVIIMTQVKWAVIGGLSIFILNLLGFEQAIRMFIGG